MTKDPTDKQPEQKLRELREAVAPLLEGLRPYPKVAHYYLRVSHPAVERLARVYEETKEDDEQRAA